MESSSRQVYGMALQLALRTGLPLAMPKYSTLNEALSIEAGVAVSPDSRPTVKCAVIGRGGAQVVVGGDNTPVMASSVHDPADSNMFKITPFAVRELTNDFDAVTLAKYRLRKVITLNNKQYAVYYGKMLDFSSSVVQMEYRTETDGVVKTTPFVPEISDMNPIPKTLNTSGTNTTTKDYLGASVKFFLNLSAEEVAEIKNACNILYNDTRLAVITEIGIVSGIDKATVGDFNGTQLTYTEIVGAQVNNTVACNYVLSSGVPDLNIALTLSSIAQRLSVS